MAVFRRSLGDDDGGVCRARSRDAECCVSLYAIDVDPRADLLRLDPEIPRVRRQLQDQPGGRPIDDASLSGLSPSHGGHRARPIHARHLERTPAARRSRRQDAAAGISGADGPPSSPGRGGRPRANDCGGVGRHARLQTHGGRDRGRNKRSLGELGSWITNRPKVGYSLSIPASDSSYERVAFRRAAYQGRLRTRDRVVPAVRGRVSRRCSRLRRALGRVSGTGDVWDASATGSLSRVPRRARAGRGTRRPAAELRSDRGHGLHLFERRYDEAEAELQASLRKSRPWRSRTSGLRCSTQRSGVG